MRRIIGCLGVDSGMMMLGDWAEFLDRVPGDPQPRAWLLPSPLPTAMPHTGLAVVTGTGDGDGLYPVTIETDAEGRVRKLSVSFK